ncbi:MAG: alpha/beta hydrolase [Actinomycetota bacterium]|nr:alpha/beta hydrolase [Actinomycetota bacterium]
MPGFQVETRGHGPRVVLVHGSVTDGATTWSAQRPLVERFTLVVVERPGYGTEPPPARIDFEEQAQGLAQLLEPGDHLVGHSYGGVISLLAAARRPDVIRSLTVNEPPAFGLARGHPAVEAFLAQFDGAPRDPRGYLEFFMPLVGSSASLPDPLPPKLEAGARAALSERPPHEAEIPLDELARAPFPKLLVSGAHNSALDAVCDVLEQRLPAERAVLRGAGHSLPRAAGYNKRLAAFLEGA